MKIKMLFALMLIGSASMAQRSENYWVIETNKFDKGKTIVRIYNNSNALLHEETLKREINIYSNRDKKFLNRKVADFTRTSDTTVAKGNRKTRRG